MFNLIEIPKNPDIDYRRKFDEAKEAGLLEIQNRGEGIGTLRERSLHAILKYWVESDNSFHEQPIGIGKFIADVFDGEVVTEIQTASFFAIKKKLERVLEKYPIRLVFPITYQKQLHWVDPETSEVTEPRLSPKRGVVWDSFRELMYIRHLLENENLVIEMLYFNMDEFKILNGWGNGGKRGAHRMERIPTEYIGRQLFCGLEDYRNLLREMKKLPPQFTVKEFAKNAKVTLNLAQRIIYTLYSSGVILRNGKKSNAFTYKITD